MKPKIIALKLYTITLRGDGIMHVHIKSNATIELADAANLIEAAGELGGEKKYPILVDCGEFASVDKEARILFANKDANIFSFANAVAYHSVAHKLFADFYVKHNKPKVPIKVFSSNESAIQWLKHFL